MRRPHRENTRVVCLKNVAIALVKEDEIMGNHSRNFSWHNRQHSILTTWDALKCQPVLLYYLGCFKNTTSLTTTCLGSPRVTKPIQLKSTSLEVPLKLLKHQFNLLIERN